MTIPKEDIAIATMKVSPPVLASIFGLTLNEWVAIATLVYIVLQVAVLIRKWRRETESEREDGGEI